MTDPPLQEPENKQGNPIFVHDNPRPHSSRHGLSYPLTSFYPAAAGFRPLCQQRAWLEEQDPHIQTVVTANEVIHPGQLEEILDRQKKRRIHPFTEKVKTPLHNSNHMEENQNVQ